MPTLSYSPETENPEIGFVLQNTLKLAIGFVLQTTRAAPPRYTVISDSNSPIRPWQK